jgi:hypothetical protein
MKPRFHPTQAQNPQPNLFSSACRENVREIIDEYIP